ncbi:hypothetical protein KUH03_12335 [Sphingobacterium sp. E70]|uniref:hypothetical protein n=1 Tax=Sphingobacterium sp. E70 TaxID=2853439 RepID=UPI00211C0145|nr:hypothetical protein [Sphingobacterium sp. E70]ULT27457.1 hypothetical protein KUH03_12335 [Sphingobacterium sp. E70]
MKDESGQLSQLDQQVIQSFKDNKVISASMDNDGATTASVGERVADKVAEFGEAGRSLFLSLYFC